MRRSIPALMAIILFACALVPFSASAHDQAQADPSEYRLVVELAHNGTPLPDAVFSLYHVGELDNSGAITLDADYAARFTMSDIREQRGWAALARDMAAYVQEAEVAPLARGATGQDGRVSFGSADGLTRGVYLVVGDDVDYQGTTYSSLPFLLTMPSWDPEKEVWLYEVVAKPKPGERTPNPPGPTPTPEPPGPTPTPDPNSPSAPTPSPSANVLPFTGDEFAFMVLALAVVLFLGIAIWGTSRERE